MQLINFLRKSIKLSKLSPNENCLIYRILGKLYILSKRHVILHRSRECITCFNKTMYIPVLRVLVKLRHVVYRKLSHVLLQILPNKKSRSNGPLERLFVHKYVNQKLFHKWFCSQTELIQGHLSVLRDAQAIKTMADVNVDNHKTTRNTLCGHGRDCLPSLRRRGNAKRQISIVTRIYNKENGKAMQPCKGFVEYNE